MFCYSVRRISLRRRVKNSSFSLVPIQVSAVRAFLPSQSLRHEQVALFIPSFPGTTGDILHSEVPTRFPHSLCHVFGGKLCRAPTWTISPPVFEEQVPMGAHHGWPVTLKPLLRLRIASSQSSSLSSIINRLSCLNLGVEIAGAYRRLLQRQPSTYFPLIRLKSSNVSAVCSVLWLTAIWPSGP
jgi:hypothetical protein